MNGNTITNSTENNYENSIGNEIDELTKVENLLNQIKDENKKFLFYHCFNF